MKPTELIKLLKLVNVLRKLKDIGKVEIKYVDSCWTIPLELDDKRINQIIDDVSIEQIRLIIKI